MAKAVAKAAGKSAAKAEPAKKAPAFAREMDMKFGIADLASALDLDETYTRAKLRNAGVKKKAKGGTAYGWNSKEDLAAVVKQLQAPAKKEAAKAVPKSAAKPAPANKNAKADSGKKAASAQKVPTGMPKPNPSTPAGSVKGAPHAPKDGAIKKVANDVKAGKAALNKNAKKS